MRRTKAQLEASKEIGDKIVALIYEGIERNAEDWRRDHLGASLLGHRCDRYLWLTFRWALNPKHDGKQLRLFGRGDREEPELIKNLEDAGMMVAGVCPATERQWGFQDGHVAGSADAIIYGVPGKDPDQPHLGEFKTHNLKSFTYLKQKRVRSAKPEHFAQMQVYMHKLGLDAGLYVAVCKDNDDIYVEVIDYDRSYAEKRMVRAQAIVDAEEPPPRLTMDAPPCVYTSKDGTRWPCDFWELCHGQAMPERNCRTCAESTPTLGPDGQPVFTCTLNQETLDGLAQRVGCNQQISIPPIINAQVAASHDVGAERTMVYQFADGEEKREEPLFKNA